MFPIHDYSPLDKERKLVRLYALITFFVEYQEFEIESMRNHHEKSKEKFIMHRQAIRKAEKDLHLLRVFFKEAEIDIKSMSRFPGVVTVAFSCRNADLQEVFNYNYKSNPAQNIRTRYLNL